MSNPSLAWKKGRFQNKWWWWWPQSGRPKCTHPNNITLFGHIWWLFFGVNKHLTSYTLYTPITLSDISRCCSTEDTLTNLKKKTCFFYWQIWPRLPATATGLRLMASYCMATSRIYWLKALGQEPLPQNWDCLMKIDRTVKGLNISLNFTLNYQLDIYHVHVWRIKWKYFNISFQNHHHPLFWKHGFLPC